MFTNWGFLMRQTVEAGWGWAKVWGMQGFRMFREVGLRGLSVVKGHNVNPKLGIYLLVSFFP